MTAWKEYTVQQLIDLNYIDEPLDGNHGGKHPKSTDYVSSGVPFIMANNLVNGKLDLDNCVFITQKQADSLDKGFAKPGDVLLTHKATLGRTAIVPDKYPLIMLTPQVTYYRCKQNIDNKYLKYYFDSAKFQSLLTSWAASGSTRAYLGITAQHKLPITLPPLAAQRKIASVLSTLDDKIELNNKINVNLEQQAQAIFKSWFVDNREKNHTIGDYIAPKRGKNLLSKDAVFGDVPVVAGGLEPATYHNVANTKSPVLTISASGANAGFVNLWNIPVWSSDSSFIDSTMTDDVYFWYILLKLRQKEIFDSQTGSAQPHIYPQHIAVLPIAELDFERISKFTKQVSPFFEQIGTNQQQSRILAALRDALLPKLMSGEIDVSSINLDTNGKSYA